MSRTLSISDRIKLFKEINRVHKEIYRSRMLYRGAWGWTEYIDIERDAREGSKGWDPIPNDEAREYYFHDDKGKDLPSLWGIFAWQAYYFYHLNPYKFSELGKNKLTVEDFILNSQGKRIRPDISHSVDCLETMIEVQQRKDNGKIWISSNWIYHYDCYGSGEGVRGLIFKTLGEAAGGDERVAKELQVKYENIEYTNSYWFKKALERYFMGGWLDVNYWDGGYLFASSKEHRIKTIEQLREVMEEEDKYFRSNLDEFVGWFKNNGLNLGGDYEESLKKRMREFYNAYICDKIKEWCKLVVEVDKVEPSNVYLWWGGEPNSDSCYAFLTLFFEVDPDDIGTKRFDEKVSRGLRALINIAENDHIALSRYREYEPSVWKAVFT